MADDERKQRTRRTRKDYDNAGRLAKTPGLRPSSEANLRTAKLLSALGTVLSAAGHDFDAAEARENAARAREAAMQPAAKHGIKFNPKPRQLDALSHAIDAALRKLGNVSAEAVLRHIEKEDDGPILKTVDGMIYWRRANGREAETAVRSFDNRVRNGRKRVRRN